MKRMYLFKDVPETDWIDWKWQLRHSITHHNDIREAFPNLPDHQVAEFKAYVEKYKFSLTPYLLSLIELDDNLNPKENDPIWNQFRFLKEIAEGTSYEVAETEENWENADEMPTKILHHKYPDRAIIRATQSCMAYCNYCYLTSRILDKETTDSKAGDKEEWQKSIEYLHSKDEIRDVLISGGDPLVLTNDRIESMLRDLRSVKTIRTIRLNTRALTFNPYRFDTGLAEIFKKYDLTALEVHICHSRELTDVADDCLKVFDESGHRPMILWRAPLLSRVNDSEEVLEDLFLNLYARRIIPYYLFHYAPFTLGRGFQGVPIRKGSKIMKSLRRKIPGPAFPRYTLFHLEGKQDIPLDDEGNHTFKYEVSKGKRIVRFENWKGNTVTYPDVQGEEK